MVMAESNSSDKEGGLMEWSTEDICEMRKSLLKGRNVESYKKFSKQKWIQVEE